MSVEQIKGNQEFDQNLPREVERKFIPLFPEQLNRYRSESQPIEQFYLSHPSEQFSLRLRESLKDGALAYEATLKDIGIVTSQGLDRLEVTAPISSDLYQYYKGADDTLPIIRKLRTEVYPGVTIDFYDDGYVQLESEAEQSWRLFSHREGDLFAEITGDKASSNEWQAHLNYRRLHGGSEALKPAEDLRVSDIICDILEHMPKTSPLRIHIGGRSGSGKTTIVDAVRNELEQLGISSAVMSTDDYHRGSTWLTEYNNGAAWTHWDDPVVYDTKAMAIDLANLASGKAIYQRKIDWTVVEPHYPAVIQPVDVIIIEGIYTLSPDVTEDDDLRYEMTTPLATCIGRRLLRDFKERPNLADPVKNLDYMLSEAEPAYRKQLNVAQLEQTVS